MSSLWASFFASLVVSMIAILTVRPIAMRLDLVDKPGGRKIHSVDVPLVGGFGMYLGLFVSLGLLPVEVRPNVEFLVICSAFVLIGLCDDRFGLPAWLRLIAQIGIALWLALNAGLTTHFLGTLVSNEKVIILDFPAVVLTTLLLTGCVNAFNMIDGIDGLAGVVGLIAVIALAGLAFHFGEALVLGVAMATAGAIIAFLLFNLPIGDRRPFHCFMGDAGSTLIGFIIAWLMLNLSQGKYASIEPASILFFAAIPIFDMLWVVGYRLWRGNSPFRADTSHLHHALITAGISHSGALIILFVLGLIMALVGLGLAMVGAEGWIALITFVLCGLFLTSFIQHASSWTRWIPSSLISND